MSSPFFLSCFCATISRALAGARGLDAEGVIVVYTPKASSLVAGGEGGLATPPPARSLMIAQP
jgi:hypothetical protein